VLLGLEPAAAWVRAARYLNCEGFSLVAGRAFRCLEASRPDVVVLEAGRDYGADWARARPRTDARIIEAGKLPPAADCPPDFAGGRFRGEFACDVAVVGDYRDGHRDAATALAASGLRVKVYGRGRWPIPQHVGWVSEGHLADAYASATITLDLDGNPSRVLAVALSGGTPVTLKPFVGTGIGILDDCPCIFNDFSDQPRMVEALKKCVKISRGAVHCSRSGLTYSDRLRDVLVEARVFEGEACSELVGPQAGGEV
jgi:hypothetical protein